MSRFGVSTHLYHGGRLEQAHLADIAAGGFTAVELFATRSHFDYHDPKAIASLAAWLQQTGLELPSVHAPIVDALVNDKWGRAYSTATRDNAAWQATMREMRAALDIAREIPFKLFVVHLGLPTAQHPDPQDNSREAAIRSVEEIYRMAEPLGVKVALEVMDNAFSTPAALVDLIENELEGLDLGICMDVGHAFMLGDTAEAIETAAGYVVAAHLHDNRRQRDDHLVPFEGGINWAEAVMAFEKIGYDGGLTFEVKSTGSAQAVLDRTARARRKLEDLMDSSQLSAFSSQ